MIKNILEVAGIAGEIIRNGFGKNFQIEFKTNEKNLVTEIDKKAEKAILDFISKKYPAHNILTEESGEYKKDSDYLWVIDPIDGTTNFAHGLPIFSISIGVMKKDEIIAGVVYDVMQNVFYSAEKGSGSFANENKINVSDNNKLGLGVLVTGFPYNIAENPDNAFERFETLTKKARAVRRLGSAAIDFCYVARGVFDGFWEVSLQPWDLCAGKLLVEEAGGIVTDFSGNEIDIFSPQILASNKKIHQQMIDGLKV
ncbi:MAG TPA: inositol monophosphatase family protein [Ignavibacteriaceae bacterium]|nr:inositol monophosphatase [Ignavibacterium sp.]HRN25919.1 inositol monophosphatase family protein [Ignavibacteriaceae bacterium]HRQ54074.1 inositol monophosphatase family protein [Ignavibacteriaceae bacterium]